VKAANISDVGERDKGEERLKEVKNKTSVS
jgi:hypothetical protein